VGAVVGHPPAADCSAGERAAVLVTRPGVARSSRGVALPFLHTSPSHLSGVAATTGQHLGVLVRVVLSART
jgi:hypothetical protein